jgi:hypothetical protein
MAALRILCHHSGLPALSDQEDSAKSVSRQIFEREQLLGGAAMYEVIVNISKMYQTIYHPTVPFNGLSRQLRHSFALRSQ